MSITQPRPAPSPKASTQELHPINIGTLMTIDQVADGFSRTPMTIYNWRSLEENALPYVRIPGIARDAIRFDRQAVAAWAEARGVSFTAPELPSEH